MRILFVDDNDLNRRIMREILSVADVHVDEAEDARKGLSMIDEGDYDVVLMDLRMPGMDGLQALEAIRTRQDSKRYIPVILVTADTGPNLLAECLREGADDFLTKPIDVEALFNSLGRIVARAGTAPI